MEGLPEGVVTFVFTDIEGSTRLWDDAPDTMMEALRQHDDAIDVAVADHNGISVKPRGEGDSRFIVFAHATDAVAAVSDIQAEFSTIDWVTPRPIRVRASVHTGSAELQLGDYYGSTVNRAARLRAIAHGGQTVISGTTWDLVQENLPDGVTAQDMGEHGLKDLTRPEHVYQLNPPGLPDHFAPLASLDAIPNNLPQQLTEFVGRDAELTEAKQLLTETRLLTILAAGGAGKTRLATQVAADVVDEYPDGVFFIGLAEVNTTDDIVQTVSESIGVAFSSDDEPLEQLLKYLANKTQLLVFDNFEHVVESATIVSAILQSAPDVTVIATSRSKLNVRGETVLVLRGLEVTWSSPERVLETSGVRLFLDAAKRSDAGFTLDPDDLGGLAQILQLTEGMPLGVLLAAAWVDMLPVAEIADEIGRSVDFLETEMGDVPDRHRSIRAVFEYSWALLSQEERDVFAALSVFKGGFSREAADQVADASLRALSTLVNKSLVSPNTAKDRYSVHELLREYAESELAEDGERFGQVHVLHCEFYADFLESALEDLFSPQQAETLDKVERDLENVRGAWRYAVQQKDAEVARKVVTPTLFLYEVRGWYPAGVALFDAGANAFGPLSGSMEEQVVGAMAVAFSCYFRALLGQPDAKAAAVANELLRDSGEEFEHWIAMQGVAITMAYSGDPQAMVETTEEMVVVGRKFDDPFWEAAGKNWRSLAAMLTGDIDSARRLAIEAMEVYEERGEYYYMTWNLWLRARFATLDARPDDAIALLAQQVESCRHIGYRRGLMVGLEGLAQAQEAAGNLEAAEHAYKESIATAEATGIVSGVLTMMAKTARVQALLGRQDEAISNLASVIAEPMSASHALADTNSAREIATEILEEIRARVDEPDFRSAYDSGASVPYEVAAKQLIQSLN